MKRILSLGVLLVICLQSYAQFSYTLGVPLSTTGWTLNAPNTYVNIDSLVEADRIFSMLMGDEVPPRRDFIEKNAVYAKIDA